MDEELSDWELQDSESPTPREITPELFAAWRSPRLGAANPERLDNPVWNWLIRTKINAYSASKRMGEFNAFELGPGWCFQRYGRTVTELADGRLVMIGGEHEDFYDPDFFIYNDVVVKHPDGRLEIHGYPREVFPPSDFHSATQLGNSILIVGSLGYSKDRKPGFTPVHLLDLETFAVRRVETHGAAPGWIHSHKARLGDDAKLLLVSGGLVDSGDSSSALEENIDEWGLDLATWTWSRMTARSWPRWEFSREDRAPLSLFEFELARAAELLAEFPQPEAVPEMEGKWTSITRAEVEMFDRLFLPELPNVEALPKSGSDGDLSTCRIQVGGVVVRYSDGHRLIRLTVEGELPPATMDALVEDFAAKFAALMKAPCLRRRL